MDRHKFFIDENQIENDKDFESALKLAGMYYDPSLVKQAYVRDTEIGEVIFYNHRGDFLHKLDGISQPMTTSVFIDYVTRQWIPTDKECFFYKRGGDGVCGQDALSET